MSYKQEVIDSAFALYSQEKSIAEVGRILKVSQFTLFSWKRKFNWTQRLEKLKEKTEEKTIDDLSEMRARQIKIVQDTQKDYIKKLERQEGETTYSDADKAMKHEIFVRGGPTERTEEQVVIQVVRRNKDGNKDKVGPKRKARRSTRDTRK